MYIATQYSAGPDGPETKVAMLEKSQTTHRMILGEACLIGRLYQIHMVSWENPVGSCEAKGRLR